MPLRELDQEDGGVLVEVDDEAKLENIPYFFVKFKEVLGIRRWARRHIWVVTWKCKHVSFEGFEETFEDEFFWGGVERDLRPV